MTNKKVERKLFNPDEITVKGSLGLLALGDVGFEAWRKVKEKHDRNIIDEIKQKEK